MRLIPNLLHHNGITDQFGAITLYSFVRPLEMVLHQIVVIIFGKKNVTGWRFSGAMVTS